MIFEILQYICSAEEADVILFITNNSPSEPFNRYLECIDSRKIIPVVSKCDLMSDRMNFAVFGKEILYLSSVTGEGIDILTSKIVEIILNR